MELKAVRDAEGGCYVSVDVTPNARKSGVKGYNEWRHSIEVAVKAPPRGGKANAELERVLGEILGCRVRVVKGATSTHKVVFAECKADFARKKFEEILGLTG